MRSEFFLLLSVSGGEGVDTFVEQNPNLPCVLGSFLERRFSDRPEAHYSRAPSKRVAIAP